MVRYDVAFIGHYTKDTIVSSTGTRVVNGGACNYGANVAARMALRTMVVTRLAREDWGVVERLDSLGVDVVARATPQSTCLRLEYPTANVDQRTIYVTSTAGAFTPEEVQGISARSWLIGASMRSELGLDVLRALRRKKTLLVADVQSFLRIDRDGLLVAASWPERDQVLSMLDILKTDAVEAELLTGESDIRAAARMIASWGPAEVVLTHRNGVLVLADEHFYEAGFAPRELVGRSGRGDTCIASYVCKRLVAPPAEATVWAAAVTSLKLEAEGPFQRDLTDVTALIASGSLNAG